MAEVEEETWIQVRGKRERNVRREAVVVKKCY